MDPSRVTFNLSKATVNEASDISWSPVGSELFALSTAANLLLKLAAARLADRRARRRLTRIQVESTLSVKVS